MVFFSQLINFIGTANSIAEVHRHVVRHLAAYLINWSAEVWYLATWEYGTNMAQVNPLTSCRSACMQTQGKRTVLCVEALEGCATTSANNSRSRKSNSAELTIRFAKLLTVFSEYLLRHLFGLRFKRQEYPPPRSSLVT